MKYYYDHELKSRAQALRKDMTRQEARLWYSFLRACPKQFRRQKQFGSYIVDFYCSAAKLVVELDGGQHFDPQAESYDQRRTEYLASLGLTVLRFSNLEVDRSFQAVCEKIDDEVKKRSQ